MRTSLQDESPSTYNRQGLAKQVKILLLREGEASETQRQKYKQKRKKQSVRGARVANLHTRALIK